MSALADYLDLRVAVGDQIGNRNLSDLMPRFVQLAEASLNKKLRCRQQITEDTLTLVNGVADLPDNFLEMLHVYGLAGRQLYSGMTAEARRSGSQYARYSIDGSQLLMYGFSGDRDIEYYAKLPTLTTSPTASNWLLEDAPEVYLYAVSLEAAKYLRDAEKIGPLNDMLQAALSDLKISDDRARWANTTVRVQGPTP